MSAIVPPTIVAPVEPNAPPRSRAMITVSISLALKIDQTSKNRARQMLEDIVHSNQDMHCPKPSNRNKMKRSSAKFLAQRSGKERSYRKTKWEDREANRCLEVSAI